jgi:predicted nucleic acid-binding protein
MMVVLDCDIISTLAKVDSIRLLKKAFPDADIRITNSVYIELLRAKKAGFSFPDNIFESIPVILMEEKELELFQSFSKKTFIHFGEAEALSIAKNRKSVFLTNDSQLSGFCEEEGILMLNLRDLLYLIAIKGAITHSEMKALLQEIETKDNTFIKDKASILKEFE